MAGFHECFMISNDVCNYIKENKSQPLSQEGHRKLCSLSLWSLTICIWIANGCYLEWVKMVRFLSASPQRNKTSLMLVQAIFESQPKMNSWWDCIGLSLSLSLSYMMFNLESQYQSNVLQELLLDKKPWAPDLG